MNHEEEGARKTDVLGCLGHEHTSKDHSAQAQARLECRHNYRPIASVGTARACGVARRMGPCHPCARTAEKTRTPRPTASGVCEAPREDPVVHTRKRIIVREHAWEMGRAEEIGQTKRTGGTRCGARGARPSVRYECMREMGAEQDVRGGHRALPFPPRLRPQASGPKHHAHFSAEQAARFINRHRYARNGDKLGNIKGASNKSCPHTYLRSAPA